MTVIEISRARIIKAIQQEPIRTLRAGNWIEPGDRSTEDSKVTSKDCSVCAVGAVLRNAALAPSNKVEKLYDAAHAGINDFYSATTYPGEALNAQEYMTALSAFFESESGRWTDTEEYDVVGEGQYRDATKYARTKYNKAYDLFMEGVRKRTVAWVKANFPKTIQIDIDGAKPAKDVKVVST